MVRSLWLVLIVAATGCSKGSREEPKARCEPGANQCYGNYLGTCMQGGASWSLGFCGQDQTCSKGGCVPLVCSPGSGTCKDEWTLLQCSDDGLTLSEEPCHLEEKCVISACLPRKCKAGEMKCIFRTRYTCTGDDWVGIECDKGQTCRDNDCKPMVCEPRTGYCIPHPKDPSKLVGLTCLPSGASWSSEQHLCEADEVCKYGFCFPKVEVPQVSDEGKEEVVEQDPGHEEWVAEDLYPEETPSLADEGFTFEDQGPLEHESSAVINGTFVALDSFVSARYVAGQEGLELMITLQSPKVDGVPFPEVMGQVQTVELHLPKIGQGATGIFTCEAGQAKLWYRFGKYLQGGGCKDYDYSADRCTVVLEVHSVDASGIAEVKGTFEGDLSDCTGSGPPVTMRDGRFHYER